MPTYEGHFFNPPAPLARVTLRNSQDGKTVSDVPMLIDSGADVTLIPQQSVTLLGASIEPDTGYEVISFDGKKSIAQVVSLDVIFLRGYPETPVGESLEVLESWRTTWTKGVRGDGEAGSGTEAISIRLNGRTMGDTGTATSSAPHAPRRDPAPSPHARGARHVTVSEPPRVPVGYVTA